VRFGRHLPAAIVSRHFANGWFLATTTSAVEPTSNLQNLKKLDVAVARTA
jgi:hypothetical protein